MLLIEISLRKPGVVIVAESAMETELLSPWHNLLILLYLFNSRLQLVDLV